MLYQLSYASKWENALGIAPVTLIPFSLTGQL
jgi:hypothetical protein